MQNHSEPQIEVSRAENAICEGQQEFRKVDYLGHAHTLNFHQLNKICCPIGQSCLRRAPNSRIEPQQLGNQVHTCESVQVKRDCLLRPNVNTKHSRCAQIGRATRL